MTSSKKIILLCVSFFFCLGLTVFSNFHSHQNEIVQSTAIASLPPVEPVVQETEEKDDFLFHSLVEGRLQSGDTLNNSLKKHNVSPIVRRQIVENLSGTLDFRRLRPNDTYRVYLDEQGQMVRCEYESGPIDCYSVTRNADSFVTQKDLVDIESRAYMVEGLISSSLFDSFQKQGVKASVVYAFADIFASRFDFNTETQKNDSFRMVIEKYFKNGEFIGFGRILQARYTQQNGKVLEGHYYRSDLTDGAYFDSEGKELGTSFIKSPVPMGRLTSKFTWKRKHPILDVVRPHLGVDLAAPIGTPIMAAADGKVVFVGRKGGFGRQVVLSHAGGYKTHYGHLSRFPKGLKRGSVVAQKEIIGYVGSSGLSTGPHLDYRLEQHGAFLDPFATNFKPKSVLAGEELALFKEKTASFSRLIDSTSAPDTLYVRHFTVEPEDNPAIL